jgi:hypothetical protein
VAVSLIASPIERQEVRQTKNAPGYCPTVRVFYSEKPNLTGRFQLYRIDSQGELQSTVNFSHSLW